MIAALEEGRSPILLTERKDHLEYFAERLRGFARHLVVLQGGMTREGAARLEGPARCDSGREERLVLATGRYIGEGFDDARLDTLFLALPVSWKGTLVQYTGRLHRLHPGKTEVRIFDYVDREVPMLLRMFEKRLRGYRAIGYARGEAPLGYAEPPERDDRIRRGRASPFRGGNLMPKAIATPETMAPSKTGLDRLIEEAIVDAYGESEQRTGFYTMLEEHWGCRSTVDILGVSVIVERIDMMDEKQIVAVCRRGQSRQSVPILEVPVPKGHP